VKEWQLQIFFSLDSIEDFIKHANLCLQQFLDPLLDSEKQIPQKILCAAKGVIFITIINKAENNDEADRVGKGILMLQNNNEIEGWNGPIAVTLTGIKKANLVRSVQRVDNIHVCHPRDEKIYSTIIINDASILHQFIHKKHFQLEENVSIAIGPLGRDTDMTLPLHIKNHYVPMVSYSINNNNDYLEFFLQYKFLSILDECNKQYYHDDDIDYNKILDGEVKPPFHKEYVKLCKTLDEYTRQQAETFVNLLTQEKK